MFYDVEAAKLPKLWLIEDIHVQKNNSAALSVGNGRKRLIPSLLPFEMNFLKVYSVNILMAGYYLE
jgi:hypothetical protein